MPEAVTTENRTTSSQSPAQIRKIALIIVGGFVFVCALIVIGSWSGFQLRRHVRAVDVAIAEKDFAGAIPHLLYLIERNPKDWTRLTQLGDCYLEIEKPDEAIAQFDSSLKLAPEQDLTARLGRAYYLQGKTEDAMKIFRDTLRENPADPYANFYLALINMKQKNYAKAAFFFLGAGADPALYERSKPYLEEIKQNLLGD